MSLANCKHCGKLFIRQKEPYCTECHSKQASMYREMREYLKRNPKSTVLDVHRNTGIPLATVLQLQKESFVPYS
ncbi:hypothetical protein [Paenibacillus hamazuiensis]|uniref:hypothetical protein n=1 Tax=Paenibacillus hamazuiensis TaxID=2936508 RepID=UPI00200FEFDC|nr:hypothetical protein [Paenibacillus hamazuiensis]